MASDSNFRFLDFNARVCLTKNFQLQYSKVIISQSAQLAAHNQTVTITVDVCAGAEGCNKGHEEETYVC